MRHLPVIFFALLVSVQALFSLGFGVALLVAWEFYEFTMDRLYGFVMQHGQRPYSHGLTDTMVDLIVGTVGCLIAMFAEAFRKVGLYGKGKEERRKAFREEIPNTTKLIIAQRISSVEDADHILVLNEGEVNGYGTHEELLENNEIYRDIYELQKKGAEE